MNDDSDFLIPGPAVPEDNDFLIPGIPADGNPAGGLGVDLNWDKGQYSNQQEQYVNEMEHRMIDTVIGDHKYSTPEHQYEPHHIGDDKNWTDASVPPAPVPWTAIGLAIAVLCISVCPKPKFPGPKQQSAPDPADPGPKEDPPSEPPKTPAPVPPTPAEPAPTPVPPTPAPAPQPLPAPAPEAPTPEPPARVCWVAREVYGYDNPSWLLFRDYLDFSAPKYFRDFYISYGERIAEFIKDKPFLKKLIKLWMDTKINLQ
jgi:hypothetical protein